MTIDTRLARDVGQGEGLELTAYRDSVRRLWTVGYGHLLNPQSHDWSGYHITPSQAATLFDSDILVSSAYAQRLPEWVALDTDCRRNAVIELCFNMRGRWLEFVNARGAIMRKDWQTAHDQLLDSEWAKEVGPQRSNRLANYLLTGAYPP